ncbi:hypothetical protein NB713_003852 [Xanthomonas sacchari]|nr:hypothetical protein [Xanthomonas sacchari]
MDDARAGRHPLHVAGAEARRRTERIGMVDQALAHDGHGLEATVRMTGKAGNLFAVIHAPAVLAAEVLADGAAMQGRRRPHRAVAGGVGIVVVDAEQERVDRVPREAKRLDLDDGVGHGEILHANAAQDWTRQPSRYGAMPTERKAAPRDILSRTGNAGMRRRRSRGAGAGAVAGRVACADRANPAVSGELNACRGATAPLRPQDPCVIGLSSPRTSIAAFPNPPAADGAGIASGWCVPNPCRRCRGCSCNGGRR